MRVGIDASNLRGGGGITHLRALLSHLDPGAQGIEQIVVWGPSATLNRLCERPWLVKSGSPDLEGSLSARLRWRRDTLGELAREACDILFAPGGLCTDRFHPVVVMSRNMLPFQWEEMRRYGPSWMLARLGLLRHLQRKSMRLADGTVFLSQFAAESVRRATGPLSGKTAVIPHGIEGVFFQPPRPQRGIETCGEAAPFRLVYTSIVDVYKHQWHVAEAVSRLRHSGFPVAVDFIGDAYPSADRRLARALRRHDPGQTYMRRLGPLEHRALAERYRAADAFVFASSCENLPNILLEAMAAGLPIASSNRGPMPEVLGDAGVYFDPLNPTQTADVLRMLLVDAELRGRLAERAYRRAGRYSWEDCAAETFRFLRDVLEGFHERRRSASSALCN